MVLKEALLFLVKLSVWFKKKGARGVRTLVFGLRSITFPLRYTLFVVHGKMLCFLYKVSHVLIRTKKRGARGVRTLVLGLIRDITFPLRYTLLVGYCKMLFLLYKVSHVLIRTKKDAKWGTVGSNTDHQSMNLAAYQCAEPSFVKAKGN